MSKTTNIGILGGANIAERFLIPTILDLRDDFQLVGVASKTPGRSKYLTEKFNTTPYDSYNEMIQEKNLHAVYIPLPNSLHYEWVKKSLQQGLHVLVEKTLACEYEQVLELNKIAAEYKLALVENFQFRFHSQLEFILGLLKEKRIGDIRNIRSHFGFPPLPDTGNIRYQKSLGGGSLLDAGAYPLKITQILLGNDVYIDSSSLYYDPIFNVDTWGSAFIKSNNSKVTSQIAFGFDNYYNCSIELWGSKGRISTNRIFTAPPEHKPLIQVETEGKIESIELSPDNHFKKILIYFLTAIKDDRIKKKEYAQNICQARLIKELRNQANES